ncbi:uncharacterized protein LOC121621343 [Chelmon rostratus]|uniref:uncharacterized protein LOC121621343 n=1 Tax=Chelmon rostratus TaxID=109905 RepID=UPI001BEADC9C|nr:uncharacterized protein LOC121621343 [Chelmon rostratus]XP_041813708.1 uncharacterized protein LOC121621343 [Chelmon rostratus]XP_041813709.1 uncharacterized protein LOC121621343 [Chelmon rostratus]
MSTADLLLELIFSWIEQRELCAEQLRKLAQELESLREKCNGGQCVGSTVSVIGAACLIGAGLTTLLTAGAAGPALGAVGAAYTGIGLTVSVAAQIIEHFVSSDTMKEAQKIEKKSNEIEEKIQKLFQQLKAEREEVSSFPDPDEVDRHIMTEVLRAVARRSGLKQKTVDRILIRAHEDTFVLDVGPRIRLGQTVEVIAVLVVLTFFTFKLSGKKYKLVFTKAAEQLIKTMTSTGFKTALKGGAMVAGGAVGLAFALPEAIDNWKELIKNNHVTEASQSLRDTADALLKISRTLREQLNNMKKMFDEMAKREREHEEKLSREKEKKEEEKRRNQKKAFIFLFIFLFFYFFRVCIRSEDTDQTPPTAIRMGLLNVRSMNNKPSRIRELISQNNLDVFATTETWLNDDTGDAVLSEASPENFRFYHETRGSRGGGVALQFSQQLRGEQIHFDVTVTFEYVAAALQHDEWDEPVLIINVYRPPGDKLNQLRAFLDEFQRLLNEVFKKYNSIIVTGDFNIWVDRMKMSSVEFDFFVLINNLDQHVQEPTHSRGHTLDLVLTRNVQISGLTVRNDGISDHYTVYFNARPVSKDTKEKTEEEIDQDEQIKRLKRREE